jgi:hypothetical protein
MAFHLYPLMRIREIGWKESLRKMRCEVVRDLNGDKVLGPDGFSMALFPKVLRGFERGHFGNF